MKKKIFKTLSVCLCSAVILSSCSAKTNDSVESTQKTSDVLTDSVLSEIEETQTEAETTIVNESTTEESSSINKTTVKSTDKTQKKQTTTAKEFEYDMSNPVVKTVIGMVGKKYWCNVVAEAAVRHANLTGYKHFIEHSNNGTTHEYYTRGPENYIELGKKIPKNQIQVGDLIYFAPGGNRNISHIAVYIGNGMAVHGNWLSDGTTKIAKAFYKEPTYVIHIDYEHKKPATKEYNEIVAEYPIKTIDEEKAEYEEHSKRAEEGRQNAKRN